MSTQENKRVVLRLFNEAMNNRNLSVINEVFDARSIHHGFTYPVVGPDGFRELLDQFLNGFPDMNIEVEKAVAEDDFVATRGTWTGTHQGDFMGIGSTGKSVKVGYIDMWRMENGKCVENWVQMDIAGLMQQLGAIAPAAVEA
ncbi:MAG: hypothetical protein JWQ09_3726 [Segetibacter sp.]|nr:hypothetical protein [Segetibacter sp.]